MSLHINNGFYSCIEKIFAFLNCTILINVFLMAGFVHYVLQRFNGLTERSRNYLTSWKENSRISSMTCGLHIQGQQQAMQFGRSIRITLLLVLSVFLIG